MDITIPIQTPIDRRACILAVEAAVKAICDHAALDEASGPPMLLTAAVHMAMTNSRMPIKDVIETMAIRLGEAVIATDDLFCLSNDGGVHH